MVLIYFSTVKKNTPTELVKEKYMKALEATVLIPTSISESPSTCWNKHATVGATTRAHVELKLLTVVDSRVYPYSKEQWVSFKEGNAEIAGPKTLKMADKHVWQNSLILFSIPVSESSLLESRAVFGKEQWDEQCAVLGKEITKLWYPAFIRAKHSKTYALLTENNFGFRACYRRHFTDIRETISLAIFTSPGEVVRNITGRSANTRELTPVVVHGAPDLLGGSRDEAP